MEGVGNDSLRVTEIGEKLEGITVDEEVTALLDPAEAEDLGSDGAGMARQGYILVVVRARPE